MKKIIVFLLLPFMLLPILAMATDYNSQYQVVQAKIYPLQSQYNSLWAIASSQACSGFSQGQQQIQCTLAASQAADVSEYIAAILKDFLTPVSDLSVSYESQLDDLNGQIFQIKMDYHQQVANISSAPIALEFKQGQIQKATDEANAKIQAIQLQEQQFTLDYQVALNQQTQQQLSCPTNTYYSNGQCFCNNGYVFNGNSCITYDQSCQNQYGVNSYGDKNNCYCNAGYQWNSSKTSCVAINCPTNSSLAGNQCFCNNGYVQSGNSCITYTQDCINNFGKNVYGVKGDKSNSSCYCDDGYQWNSPRTSCIPIPAPVVDYSKPITPTATPISVSVVAPTPSPEAGLVEGATYTPTPTPALTASPRHSAAPKVVPKKSLETTPTLTPSPTIENTKLNSAPRATDQNEPKQQEPPKQKPSIIKNVWNSTTGFFGKLFKKWF